MVSLASTKNSRLIAMTCWNLYIVVFIIFGSVTKRNVITYSIHKPNTNLPPTPLTTYLTPPSFFVENPRKHLKTTTEATTKAKRVKVLRGQWLGLRNYFTSGTVDPVVGPTFGERAGGRKVSPWCFFCLGPTKRANYRVMNILWFGRFLEVFFLMMNHKIFFEWW